MSTAPKVARPARSPIQERVPWPASLEALAPEYATWMRAAGLAERTVEERLYRVGRFAAVTGVDPVTATTGDVAGFLAAPRLSAAGRQTYASQLRAWFRWLVYAGHRDDDPTLRLRPPRAPRRRARPVSEADLARLLASRMQRDTRAMILLAAFAGLRVHEIAKLAGRDVDLRERTLLVVGKGGHDAVLPLHPALVEVAERMPGDGWWFPCHKPNRLFPYGDGHVLPRSVSTVIGNAMRRAGVPGTPHALRHRYGTQALRAAGGNLRVAQELLRHASPQTTAIYTQVDDSERRAAVLALPDVPRAS